MSPFEEKEKEVILEVKNLKTYFYDHDNVVWKVLDGVNFKIHQGETLGILGPSGAGKSILAKSIFKLIERPGKIIDGEILFKGRNLLLLPNEILDTMRGKDLALVMQNVAGGIDPLRDMTFTTSQPYREHAEIDSNRQEIKMLVISQLGTVAIPEPLRTSDKYAHQMSGGESQRVKIATALINNPSLLIADEPVSNLDATIARQILDLLQIMKKKYRLTMMIIAHNLGVLAELSDYIAILYAGEIIEYGDVETMFYSPRHPFTQGLFYATPSMAQRGKLKPIPGEIPDPRNYPSGCRFHPRCTYAIDKCKIEAPNLVEYEENHQVACWRAKDIPDYQPG